MSTAIATRTFRDLLIAGLDVAIDAARPQADGCPDCPESVTGLCAPHQEDQDFADDLQRAQERIRAASDEDVAALTAQGGN